MFQPTVAQKLCSVCGMHSWGGDALQCVLCKRWAHYDDDNKKCDSYYEEYDLNNMIGANLYCKTCLDVLVRCYANMFDDTKIEGIQTCLRSFNIDKVLENQEDLIVFNYAITNAIEHYRSSNSSNVLADVPMEEV